MKRSEWANRGINYLFVLFAFIMPIITPTTNGVMILLILLWIIEGRWKDKFEILNGSPAFKLYAAFILLLGLSLFWSGGIDGGFTRNDANAVEYYFRRYIFGFILIPMILTSVKKTFIPYIISAFLAAMFISEMMSWGIYMEWITYKDIPAHDPSPFMSHSLYSIFLAVTVFVLMTRFFQTERFYYRIFIALFALSAMVNLFLNGGRLGQLAFFVALFVYIVLRYRVTFKSISLSILSIGLIFVSAYTVSPIFQKRMNLSLKSLEKITKGDYNSSWGVRVNILRVSKDIVIENPILGIGIGNTKTEFLEKAKEYDQTGFFPKLDHLHNGYMQILVETGLVGLFLFLSFLFLLLRLDIPRDSFILLSIVITIYLVGFIGEPLFFNSKPYLLFNLFMALIMLESLSGREVRGKRDALSR
ncbi:MAG: O-antigen ligase family protein [Sulfurimonas sp.]